MILATIILTAALAGNPYPDVFNGANFGLRISDKTEMVLGDDDGASVAIHGSGFKYSHGEATDGIITSATIRDEDGHLLLRVKHAHIEASQMFVDLDKYSVSAFYWIFAAGNDDVIGSKKDDVLQGDYGDDVVEGRGGDDLLTGNTGKDVLIGGAGDDTFAFTKTWGVDVIKDFEDSGKDQDIIRLQYKSMWNNMDKYQDGDDVVLDFGHGDKLIIKDAHQAHITQADFHFG
jgi:Ca2+-binding RTX toxin-like protein